MYTKTFDTYRHKCGERGVAEKLDLDLRFGARALYVW